MSQGGFLTALPLVQWKPQDFLEKEVVQEEQDKWETVEEKLEVKDVEFEKNQAEVARLRMNPHQVWGRRQS